MMDIHDKTSELLERTRDNSRCWLSDYTDHIRLLDYETKRLETENAALRQDLSATNSIIGKQLAAAVLPTVMILRAALPALMDNSDCNKPPIVESFEIAALLLRNRGQ